MNMPGVTPRHGVASTATLRGFVRRLTSVSLPEADALLRRHGDQRSSYQPHERADQDLHPRA